MGDVCAAWIEWTLDEWSEYFTECWRAASHPRKLPADRTEDRRFALAAVRCYLGETEVATEQDLRSESATLIAKKEFVCRCGVTPRTVSVGTRGTRINKRYIGTSTFWGSHRCL